MDTEPATTVPAAHTTTARGLATASFSLGLWGMLVFWWYPFGAALAAVGLLLGLGTVAFGVRAGRDGEHLALAGIAFSLTALGLAFTIFRFFQFAFEGSIPFDLPW